MSSEAQQKALKEAKQARDAWGNMAASSNIKVSVIRRHFDALGEEINRLNVELARKITEIQKLEADIRSINRQRIQEAHP